MAYVDGFAAAVPTANKQKYLEFTKKSALVFKECGALSITECWGDDVPSGEVTSFPMAVKCKDDETVVFSWVVWPDKTTRNEGMSKLMTDPRMQPENNPMPFDGKRLIYGGFDLLYEA